MCRRCTRVYRSPAYVRTRARLHVREVTRGWVGISDIYGQYFRFSCRYRSPYQFNMSAIKNWIKLYPHLATSFDSLKLVKSYGAARGVGEDTRNSILLSPRAPRFFFLFPFCSASPFLCSFLFFCFCSLSFSLSLLFFFNILREAAMRESIDFESIKRHNLYPPPLERPILLLLFAPDGENSRRSEEKRRRTK